ncbi:hypothetical protein [Kribbella sp. VKM Ac-2568]|uniref:hypothetical protein n=1 Tax=Kribbella sp. VKM Ac-2568 TaxID=2512219 RepID=UPI001048781D|nr:hypothetical protein [Kribbella sp. VKM Ac-2568]TCM49004.1 hypothetical protein EV648_103272 [Kribbella sp. VKM Ac-2568]
MALPSWIEDLLFGPKVYVSPFGNDDNPGTFALPKRTVAGGLAALPRAGGGRLHLRGGTYVENVEVSGYKGLPWRPLVIRSHPGEQASIDGSVAEFREVGNEQWSPVPEHPGEFISNVSYPRTMADEHAESVARGAFIDRVPYTRLVTYSRLEDLRAQNTTFAKISAADPRPGPEVVPCKDLAESDQDDQTSEDQLADEEPEGGDEPVGDGPERRPWVYMGPGIYFDETSRRVHIRLSHTSNGIEGLAEYVGETDPGEVRLALSAGQDTALRITDSAFIKVTDVMLRFGGENTVVLRDTNDVVFDHVRVLAASRAIRLGDGNARTEFRHCEVRGGWPTWLFRGDRKNEYCFMDNGQRVRNELGKHTSSVILSGQGSNTDTQVHHCEFVDGHDLYMFGAGMRFHHNWVHNLNDDAIALNAVAPTVDARVWQNVITKCLMAISYGNQNHVSGQCSVYRNLIDLRQPTAGVRRRYEGDQDVWRQGAFYKSNNVDGPLDLFHNTAVTLAAGAIMPAGTGLTNAAFNHYGHHAIGRLRSFNNVFVAVTPEGFTDRPVAFIPSELFPGPTDGNCYFRTGHLPPWTPPMFHINAFPDPNDTEPPIGLFPGHDYNSLDIYRGSPQFELSKVQYPPGYEHESIDVDPEFRSWQPVGTSDEDHDDLRLSEGSPGQKHGVTLPDSLDELDPLSMSWLPDFARPLPDMGCYGNLGQPLAVGVDSRRRFPNP